ncbi:MAG: hypothetical protein J7L88_04935 [Thermoplasmata archaeon]|nr:hypothetical protein [Thermoplasmata archaeon]
MMEKDFLLKLRFHTLPLPRRIRKEVLREIDSHLKEARASAGEVGVDRTIRRFGDPSRLALNYIRIWGVSISFLLFLSLVGFVLGAFSSPVKISYLGYSPHHPFPIILYALLIILLIWVGYRYGLTPGVVLGLMASIGYSFNVILSYNVYGEWTIITNATILTLAINAILLPLTGAIVGHISERIWELSMEDRG